jgi:hypothetical protein
MGALSSLGGIPVGSGSRKAAGFNLQNGNQKRGLRYDPPPFDPSAFSPTGT